jgi:hypothetical protein
MGGKDTEIRRRDAAAWTEFQRVDLFWIPERINAKRYRRMRPAESSFSKTETVSRFGNRNRLNG